MQTKSYGYRAIALPVIITLKWLLFVSSLAGILISCSPRQMMVKEMTTLVEDGVKVFENDSDLAMIAKAMPSHIKLTEAMLAQSPDNRKLRILLAQLYGAYAFAFDETDLEAKYYGSDNLILSDHRFYSTQKIKQELSYHFFKGAEYAKSVLSLKYPEAKKALRNVVLRDKFIQRLTREDVAALFWYGFNLGGYVSQNLDSVRAMALGGQIEAVMQRVIALSPDYYYGTAHMVLMVFYAARPPMLGGRLEAALDHYKTLNAIAGDHFLLADALYARYCLTRTHDRNAFEAILGRVSKTPVEPSQAFALFNQVAATRAQIYLRAADQLFNE
jgi:hypothetical protein